MTLPADISRCQGIAPDSLPCPMRHKCERYMALFERDPAGPLQIMRFMCATPDDRVDESFPMFIEASQ